MNKLNLFSKLVIVTVVGASSTIVFGVNSAQAQIQLSLQEAINTCIAFGACSVADKSVYDFTVGGDLSAGGNPFVVNPIYEDALVEFVQNPTDPEDFELELDFAQSQAIVFGGNATFGYTIQIDPDQPPEEAQFFRGVAVDSGVFGVEPIDPGTSLIVKNIDGIDIVESPNGNREADFLSGQRMVLDIVDTISTTGTGEINTVLNEFTQAPKSTPEPGTIIGLLAVGGLGLGLKRKKQS